MKQYNLKRCLTDAEGEAIRTKFLDENSYDILIDHDSDGYDLAGNMLFRFRKNVIPEEVLLSGYNAFKDSIKPTEGRGAASGGYFNRLNKNGTIGKMNVSNLVLSGNVGFMDAEGPIKYCRKTAFARAYFEKFKEGIPFVEHIDKLYKELCPVHYEKQLRVARATDINYRIADTAFTTVTVNKNFQTAVHKDSGDYPEGFGNLCVYREGNWSGAYFCLPEFRVAIDLRNCDMLFVDVHRWHGNTPFVNMNPETGMRISFVMYYREYMFLCKNPSEELEKVKQTWGGFFKL